MDKKLSTKMPRREANYLSLQEWIKPKKIPRKFELGVSALLQLYRQGNIHNLNTAKNEINKLISTTNPNTVMVNTLLKYANKQPVAMRNQDMRLGRLSKGIKKAFKHLKKKELKYYYVSCLIFTRETMDRKKPDFKKYGIEYYIIQNHANENWRAYRD